MPIERLTNNSLWPAVSKAFFRSKKMMCSWLLQLIAWMTVDRKMSKLCRHNLLLKKPNWSGDRWRWRNSMIFWCTSFSRTLEVSHNNEMGLWFATAEPLPLVKTGMITLVFHSHGREAELIQWSNNFVRGEVSGIAHSLYNLVPILSGPW